MGCLKYEFLGESLLIGFVRPVTYGPLPEGVVPEREQIASVGIDPTAIYEDQAFGDGDAREGLNACLAALHPGDTLVVWRLEAISVDLRELVAIIHALSTNGTFLRVLNGPGAGVDPIDWAGTPIRRVLSALSKFEPSPAPSPIRQGYSTSRTRGRSGGRPYKMTPEMVRRASASMRKSGTRVSDLCEEFGITRQTLYRHVAPDGELRADGRRLVYKFEKTTR